MSRHLNNGKFISKMDALPPDDIIQDYLIKGSDYIELPNKYLVDGHVMHVEIKFYAAIKNQGKYPLSQAIITDLKPACCNVDETAEEHKNKLQEWRMYSWTIGKFVNLKKIKFDFECMDKWILIKSLDEKEVWED